MNKKNLHDVYPLAPMQSGLLFQSLYAPESDAYFLQGIFELEGEISASTMKSAWQKVSNFHPILRTGFIWESLETPMQYVIESAEVPFAIENWEHISLKKQQNKLDQFIKADRKRGFDLKKAPLFRVTLIKYAKNKYYLIWSQHHIITDGWCWPIIFGDVLKSYEDISLGKEPSLKARRPYRDYIAWLQQQKLDTAETFWKNYLASINEPTRLSFSNIIDENKSKDYDMCSVSLSIEETEEIKSFAKQHNLTLNTVIQGAVGIVLRTYTQKNEIVMGVTVSGRDIELPGIEEMVGLFINTLPLKISFDPEVNILSFLKSLQNNTQQLNNHSFTPLAQIQSWSNINQSLFDVLFVFENYPYNEKLYDKALEISIKRGKWIERTEYPLTITTILDTQLNFFLNYQTADFNEEFIKRFVNHIRITLQKIIQSPKKGSHDLCLLTSVEKQQLLIEWNNTKAPYPSNKCIHELFEEQVDKTPDSIAVIYEDQELSYQQLNERANQLAHYLRSLGVGPDTLVAIAVERSLEMIIGLLGILKAGGAYVPLDPSYPQERIKFMLEDTQASILITQQSLKDGFKDYAGTIIALDKDWKIIQHQSRTNLITLTYPHHLAYVIYTSGSTGKPKGVMINHNNLINYLNYSKKTYIPSTEAVPIFSPIAFDMSITSLFLPIVTGSSIYLLPQGDDIDPLIQTLKQPSCFSFIKLTPAHLRVLKEYHNIEQTSIKKANLIVGGENLLKNDIKYWTQTFADAFIFNEYGPTEATVGCCVFSFKNPYMLPSSDSISIGQPISNTQIYILDTYLNPIPIGVTGEIYIGGAGLARGYLNRPDLTADRFIPNPFISDEDAQQGINLRLYRTGDLARYLPDGNIEFIGRIDDQVKIRGFRIELGEIESTLADHGDVANAIVTVREDEPDNKRLVAYIVAGDFIPSSIELKEYLAQSLPDYMVPSFFVFIDKVPLSPNGKIDRKSLPAPDLSFRNLEDEYVAPSTPLEQELASIWTEVLKIESIGIHDNFFKIGGHSLLATQVISRIRHNYNIDIPLRSLFDHPSIASLSLVVDSLVTGKVNSSLPAIVPMERGSSIPLSFAQQRLWFLDQLLPDSALYNIPIALRLKGSLNLIALEDALNALMQRHESLRTIFPSSQGEASQVILPTYRLDIKDNIIDLANLPSEEQESSLQDIALKEANSPFNLSIGPLVRIKLISLAGKEYALLMTMHHIVSDGWSGSIFFRELSALYNAYAEGNDPLLPSLTIQYADFALWQRKWLQGEVLEQQLSYWKEQLADIPDLLELPTDKPRPKELSHKGGSYHYVLSKDIRDQLNSLAHKNQASLFMTLLTAFQILLYRYSGQKDIVVGSPIANRHYKEIEGIIGFFVNTLALRTTFKDHETFIDILNQVKETTLQAYQHQDVPFEQLVDYLNISRALNRNPVFQVLFTLEKVREENPLIFNSVDINPLHLADPAAKFDLSFNVHEGNDGIGIEISYETDLFEYSTIERMGLNFKELIQAIIKDPIQPIEELSILTTEERQQLLIEWNDTKAPYPSNKCIHELFEEQVDKTPDSIAVVYEDQELSYQQLNERANQLAHYLRSLGVGPDTLVAIAVERSLEMIIGLLGILKAGGAYVPLDPSYPQERIKFMLEDTQASILITQQSLKDGFKDYAGTIIALDKDWKIIQHQSRTNLITLTYPHHLAYVIYTSGSTGKPKGVYNTHQGLSNRLLWTLDHYSLSEQDTFLYIASLGFDISIWEMIFPLLKGSSLVIPLESQRKGFFILMNLINKHQVTILHFVPSILDLLIQSVGLQKCNSLTRIITGGEVLSNELRQKFIRNFINTDLYLAYGPSEASISVTHWNCNTQNHMSKVYIGQPISNTQIYILDTYLNPIPVGITGEIYIGGAGLARGYLNRPDLTADRFIPNPFISGEDAQQGINLRLYRTGDLARYLPDGNIEFIGRIDDQVKIRGFRIELGEIESTLADHGDIANAIVTVREDESDNKRLVAYIVPKQNKFLSLTTESTFTSSSDDKISVLSGDGLITLTETLRNHLAQSLPDYMVPSFFVFIDKVPLSPNGKIDRKSLPAPDLSFRNLEDEYVAPSTPLEQELASIWTEVLKIESIGIHDNFFKIGGHSLLATQVISRIRHNYNIDIPLRSLFDHPSIASLSLVVDSLVTGKVNSSLPAIVPMERGSSIPLSFAQQRLWFLDQLLPDSALYNIPIALRLKGSLNLIALEDALNALMQRHESLRTIFPSSQGEASQVILPTYRLDIKDNIIDLANLPSEEQESSLQDIALKEANSPFNLSIGPLVRIKLISLADKEYALLMTMHHIVSDGWSMGIFFKELSSLYNSYNENNLPSLSPLNIQYADFALWQRKWLQGEVLEQQLSYWKEQLADIPDLLELPTDKPRPKELSHKGGSYHYVLSKDIRDQLNSLAHKNQASLFMTLLTAFQILLYRYSGQKDIVVGSPIANRHYKEIEGIIGFFVNTLALRTTFKDHETFIDILNQVKETTLQAYQHQDVPFEQLVDYLNISRALNRNPVFQVLFTLEKVREENPLIFNSVDINPLHLADPAAKFDLSFNVHEGNDGIGIEISYETDLFEYSTIERMGLNFKELIQAIIKDPIQPIEELSILTTEERQQLLIEWNDTKAPYPSNKCIHELFEEQVDKTPDSIAVVYEDQELSYQQLNERANQLAHYLRSLGVGPDTLVAIAVERSLEMIIGLLGILKAGGAYVPLDPSYPQERIKFMLEDTQASILITQQSLKDGFKDYAGTIIALDKDWKIIQHQSRTNLITLTYPHHLAYVIYTSGSTGKPKGVMINHFAILNFVKNFPSKGNKNKATIWSNIGFDVSLYEIWDLFQIGGSLYIPTERIRIDPLSFFNYLVKYAITSAYLPPYMINKLLDFINNFRLEKLLIGVEPIAQTFLLSLNRKMPNLKVVNGYGPTEATICTTSYLILQENKYCSLNIPIGQPISNTQIYILDTYLNPIPIGVTGEIYIGGAGLARGYLNRPDLTADRFIPNPFISDGDAQQGINLRLYRTGDLARYLPDGNIEFIGRIDDQVKIRGFRIELGEIESTLADHGDVANAIVTVREDEPDNKRLVAYIVPKQNKFLSLTTESTFTSSSDDKISVLSGDGLIALTETLRNHLAQSLPDYMVPSFFVFIDKVPLSPNGKIDRKSLPAPDLSFRNLEDEYVAPSTPLEQELASIWTEVLKIESIGIHDNFFKIGGHSLLATQVISRIRHNYNIDIPLRSLFDHPSIASLSLVVDSLVTGKVNSSLPAIVPMERGSSIPLSFAQQRLWFLDQLLPDSALYNIPIALRLKGSLNLIALEDALNALMQRHESLRTIFPSSQGEASQVILPTYRLDIKDNIIDLANLPSEEQESSLQDIALKEANSPFNLSIGPLVRIKLISLAGKEYALLMTMHHIVSDGWSGSIFFRELSALYNAYAEGNDPLLPSLTIQYADFALWQRKWLQGEVLEQQLSYWKEQLADIPDLLELPTDKPRPKELSHKGGSYHYVLSKDIRDQLNSLAHKNQASLFMTLLTAFQILLYRYSGQKDIVIGSPIANRHYKEIEGIIGFFVNTLALRTTFKDHETFIDILNQVKETTLQAYQHQDVYFDQLVDYLNISRALNRNPVFQVEFSLESLSHNKEIPLNDILIEALHVENSVARFDLRVLINETKDALFLHIDYSTDLFNLLTIEKLAIHFEELLKSIIKDPIQPIEELSILTAEERQQLLIEWNNTKAPYPSNKCIHELFEEQVDKTPDSIAVVYEDQELSYQQLNERANQLAHYLRSLGVGPDTLVAIAVERSLEMIIGLLGILKAGGAYVPLDPSYPQERIKFMLEDTNVSIMITDINTIDKLPSTWARVICLDDEWSQIKTLSSSPLEQITMSYNLAYVIYTSGSTGIPKGVMITQKNLLKSSNARLNYYYNSSPLNFLLLSSISFDSSIVGIFWPLISGGKIILPNNISINNILEQIKKYKISHLLCISSIYTMLLASQVELRYTQSLVTVILAGEDCNGLLNVQHQESFPWISLFNEYGPTEVCVWSSVSSLYNAQNKFTSDKISIGQPISNTQIYILDTYLNPIPVGITGEIYIGGAGLARGYLNRPDLTADRFIPNPFISDEDAQQGINLRLYRTGDLARYLPDGNIEFIGRIDDQVKIRGFRIELGEIESTLADHGDIANAIVTVREDEPDNKRLVAYIVPKQNKFLSLTTESTFTSSSDDKISVLSGDGLITLTETLRNHLAQSLPDYMVPSFFVFIDKVPLSPNGKIDRKSLPAPDLSFRNLEDEYVAPSTPLEQELASIWTEVLKIESIGIHDNFFKIGGHSLLATQVISRIRHNYNIDIPLRSLFDHPSIASLSLVVDSLVTGKVNSSLPAIVPMERGSSIPLSFAQQRLWFLDQLLPDSALYNIPIALRLKGSLNLIALEDALNALMQRHESLRTIFPSSQGEASQVILPTYRLDIKDNIIDLANLPSEEQESSLQDIALKEANSPFNLSIGPLVRIKLISLADKEYALLMTMHHIVSDGWSMGIFFKELSSLYNSYNENNLPSLSPLNIQYADFALWQRKWLQGEVLEQQLSYWKEQLADIPDLLELPTDKPRPKELSHKGGSYHYVLSKDIRDQLNSLAHKNQASLFMTLLTAFQILLYRYSGQKDIVVGSPIANRHYKEIEGIIGFFVNTLALRTTFKDHETFIDILNQVKETTLQAYQHQDVPFEQLVDYLNISRALNRNPVFQVLFTLEKVREENPLIFNSVDINPLHLADPAAKFDLSFNVHEGNDGIGIEISYETDLFEYSTIERMGLNFKELIQAIIKDPIQPIEELSILTAEERQQLLIEWNDTKAPYPSNKCIHELFEEQVDKTPDSIAVVYEDQELSYQQLNEKANQLAHYLRSLGVGLDTLVAIAVERSLEMIIGLLGILKAGGAYVPLDPSYPQERIKFMLEDTQASILITQQSLKDGFKDYAGTIIALDKDWKIIQHQSRTNLITLTYPHHLAYVIYTSGSTGKPKGVMINHNNLINYLNYSKKTYIPSTEAVPIFSPIAFDMSITSLFLPIVTGSSIYLLPQGDDIDPLIQTLKQPSCFSFIKLTPAHLRVLKEYHNIEQTSIKKANLIVGGENLLKNDIKYWTQTFADAFIFNEYGPTEATVGCCVFSFKNPYMLPSSDSISIGQPISNTQIYILDTYLNPIPIGVTGEIYIGGAGLARGYLNRPDLTADRFIPNPFISDEDAQQGINLRLYRTGDLARYLPDGNIEFIGRIDDQVKIRGFRIELGEIESTLADHGDVANAIVTVREDEPDNKRLVAYIVAGDFIPSSIELKEYLAQSLPDYMVPSFFVFIDKVPLSPNGKIDRKSLPAPDLSFRNLEDEYVAPSTPLEQELASIWTEVLKIESIGIHNNFFRIGGDSIVSIQIIAKARQKKIYFKVKDIFNHPTIASLSTVVQIQENVSALIPNQDLMTGELLLTPIQHWFFDHNFPDKHHYNQATLLQAQETIVFPILVKTVSYLINHHDALRLRYKKTKKHTWIQECYEKEENIICKTVDLSLSSDTNLPYDIEKECSIIQQSLNIEKGPIIRVCLFDCGINRPQRLLIVIHHLAVDGVSWRILLEDLEKVYINLFKEENPSLPPKTHSYQQWAKSLMEYSLSSELNEQIPYWTKVFSFIKPLPIDFDKRLTINSITKTISVSLLKEETTDLLQRVPKAYRTQINDILLTALVLTVGDWTGNYELSLSLEGHGREDIIKDIDLSRTVGWFTSIFPVYLHIENHRDLGEAIKTVKETLRQIPNKGIGYGILTYLNRNSTLNNTPYPNLSFNYLGQWDNILNQQDRLFAFTQESPGESTSKNNTESFLIDINGSVQNGILQLFWSYSTNHYQHSTIERLANSFIDKLKQLIQYCYNNDNYHYTASDFDLIKVERLHLIQKQLTNKN